MARNSSKYLWLILPVACAQFVWPQTPAVSPPPASPKVEDRVVISVGEEKITASDIEKIIQALPPQFRAYYNGPGKSQLPQYIVQMKVLAAEAARHNLANQPEVREALALATQSILADAERKRIAASIPVSDQEVQDLYQQRKAEFEQLRIAHILLRTDKSALPPAAAPPRPPLPEAEARTKLEDLRRQVLEGADFAELARNYSEDLATAGSGGDMGYVTAQTAVPPILTAAKALSPGQVSEIISTPYGLEIVKVEDKHTKTLAEAKPDLVAEIQKGQLQEAIARLSDEYHVVVDSQYFGPQKVSSPLPSSPATKE